MLIACNSNRILKLKKKILPSHEKPYEIERQKNLHNFKEFRNVSYYRVILHNQNWMFKMIFLKLLLTK